ncbi:MAG: NAD-binding protein, partial [Coriobacteriales bacterium]|nr:NAD-binding protein [Coriobacteriales bacterium]
EDIYFGSGGILEKAAEGSLFIEMTTSSPKLAREMHALAAVHDHGFVEAPLEGDPTVSTTSFEALRLFAAGEPDNLKLAAPVLEAISPNVVQAGLPGLGMAAKAVTQIALAGALLGVVEAVTFALLAGIDKERIVGLLNDGLTASAVAGYYGQKTIDEEFYFGGDLHSFFCDLTVALDAADELDLALPGLETAHQLYDLLVLVGGGEKGIHALALIYYDEQRCASHGLNWELAQRAMDVYERAGEGYYEDYDFDDDECDDPNCSHHHHHHGDDEDDDDGEAPSMGDLFSAN